MIKIAGVVIAYFPDISKLIVNINTYIDYIELLYIVYNSPLTTDEIIKLQSTSSKIQLIINQENAGIASSLNQTAQKALSLGYEWLLTMDQDSCFQNNDYFKAFDRSNYKNVAIFCPTSDSSLEFNTNNIDETTEDLNVITSGNLLNLEIWKTLGGFEQKLFIDEVDNDYCLKANLNGFKIIRFINIPLVHELGQNKEVTFFFKKYTIIIHPPIRAYYIFRNNFYIFSKYKHLFPEFVKSRKIMLLKVFIKILLFSENRIQNCRYIYSGIKDYFHGSYGSYLSEKPKTIAE
jgi:rhamnosyltransferase